MNARAPNANMQLRLANVLVNAVTAFVVLTAGTILSAAAAYFMARQVEHDASLKFERVVAEAEDAIETRIRAYSDVLLGVRALFIASDSVTRDEFQTYVASLDLNRRYPGIQVIHFAQRVPDSQRWAFEAMVRYDRSVDPRGYPDFAVKPPGNRPEYFIVQYVEPMAGNEAALGLDLGGDAVRLAALERTRDSGQITASGTIALALDPRRHPGFAMRVPVYRKGMPVATVEQRREAFTGMVSTSFIVIDLMRGVLSEPFLRTMHVRIHDAGFLDSPRGMQQPSAENRMFDSDRLRPAGSRPDISGGSELANLTSTSGLEVGGRRWNLHFSAREGFIAPSERLLPWAVFLVGAVISLLLFGMIRSLATSGRRAIYLAERITQDLRKSEASLAEAQRMTQQLIETLPNPIFFKGTDGRYLGVNRAWETFFGMPRETFIGKTVHDLYPNDPNVADRLHAMDQVLWEHPGSQVYETSITTPDGRRHDAIYYKATFTRADASVAGLIGTIIDITERKDLERRFELTFDYAAVGILHTSLDRRMLLANKRFLDMTGYSLEELRDKPTAMIIVPDDVNTDAGQEQQLLEGRIDTYQSEKRYLGKHGRVISTRRTTSVARSADGTPQYYIRVIEDVTETKLNEERYRVMFENAAVGITRVDLNGVLVDANQKFCDMLGYGRDELLGKAVMEITHPDDYGQGTVFRGQVTQGAVKAAIGEKRFLRKDGAIIWARRTMSVARDDAGNPQYVISVVEDITERKQLEQRFEATFNQVAVGIAHTSIDGRYLMVNRRFCEMLGYSESELTGQSVADFAYPEDREKGRDFRQLLWDNKLDKFSEEKRYLRKDGSVIWTNRTVSLARDASGQPMYFIRVIEDITARKEVEERYRATFDNAPVGIMHTAIEDYRILRANRKLSEMLGYTQDELLGMTSTEIVHPDYRFTDQSRYKTQMLKEEVPSYSSERKFLRKDGSSIWVNRTVSLVNDAAGKPLYFIRIIEDISERKQAEERQAMEHAVTRVLAEAETLAEAIPRIIQTICEAMNWHCGACWQWDIETGLLRCTECWGIDTPEIREFMADNRSRTIEPGTAPDQGLVRRIYNTGQPVWIADISREKGLTRMPLVIKAGLHGAFGFPLLHGKEVLGVLEFFHRDVREPDDMLVQITRSIGDQIAQFVVRQQAEERVRRLAHYDELTGLPNRTMFNERLSHALTHARRTDRSLATLFIDLDRFKNINDTLGHEAGDDVLKEVAVRLRGCLRESDTVGRLGGDEFVVLIEEPPQPVNAAAVAQKVLAAMGMPFLVQAQEFHVTASIGISTYPADGADIQVLMKNADIAMYRAKEQGKNNFQFYSAQTNVHSIERLTLESSLRRALERNEFLLHYQPKMNIASGRITGVEALLRWQQPAHELIPPAQFIHLAEETGLIVPIGEWVLRTACAQNKAWQQQGLAPVRVAVNLSPRQFAYERLLEDVAGALKQSGLDPAFLELEITESMVMNNPEQAVILLNKLKAFGIHLAIDDFGTGYSSLNYLKRFPIDSLKIDRTFIRDLPGDADDAAITQAIIAMAHSLRLGVVAEGVETAEQLRFLRDYKCDEIQGYYFSRPRPAADIAPLLRDNATAGKVRSVS